MNKIVEKRLSEELYILKAVAICSVAMAHSCYTEVQNPIDIYFLGQFARFGVFAFFFLSGFFFKHEGFITFAKKTLINFIIPWVFVGTSVYFGSMLINEHKIRFNGFFYYLIGNGSTLYFCTVLLIVRCVFQAITQKTKRLTLICIGCIVCTLISLLITAMGVLPQDFNPSLKLYQYINPYLNVFNWIGIFAGGILTRQYSGFDLLASNIRVKTISCLVSIVIILLGFLDSGSSYWSFLGIYVELSFFVLLFCLVKAFYPVLKMGGVLFAGKNTFPLFLMHYPVLALLMHGAQLRSSFIVAVIRAVMCIAILCGVFHLCLLLAKRMRVTQIFRTLTGIK